MLTGGFVTRQYDNEGKCDRTNGSVLNNYDDVVDDEKHEERNERNVAERSVEIKKKKN